MINLILFSIESKGEVYENYYKDFKILTCYMF